MTLSPGSRDHLTALADDEHLIGARHTSWIGLGPFLEEDLAFCSIAQDELGHAIALYELLLADQGRPPDDVDDLALMREPGDYRSCHLAEIECSAWSDSLVRHWLYDRAETLRWEALTGSTDERVAAVAERALREETFHLAHAGQLMARITPNDPGPIRDAIDRLLPIAVQLWAPVQGEADALGAGITTASSAELAERWELAIRGDLAGWGLDAVWPASASPVADRTVRSEGFDVLLVDLRKVVVLDPAATW